MWSTSSDIFGWLAVRDRGATGNCWVGGRDAAKTLWCTGHSLTSIVSRWRKPGLEGPKAQGHSYQEDTRQACSARAVITEEKPSVAEMGRNALYTLHSRWWDKYEHGGGKNMIFSYMYTEVSTYTRLTILEKRSLLTWQRVSLIHDLVIRPWAGFQFSLVLSTEHFYAVHKLYNPTWGTWT